MQIKKNKPIRKKPSLFIILLIFSFVAIFVFSAVFYPLPVRDANINETFSFEISKLININTAPLKELLLLPGIGENTATAIIDYRERNGPFLSLADLAKVPGIGKKTIEKLDGLIAF